MKNILDIKQKEEFYNWLKKHHQTEQECFLEVKKGRPTNQQQLFYIDAVEVALCFRWIDSSNKIVDGKRLQRFSKRKKNSVWTELNKERVRRLEKLGLMTQAGRDILPPMDIHNFQIDKDIEDALKKARVYTKFKKFPPLYQRIRAYNVAFYKNKDKDTYDKALNHLIEETKKKKCLENGTIMVDY